MREVGGTVIAVGVVAIFMIIFAIFLPIPTDYRLFVGFFGGCLLLLDGCILLLLAAGVIFQKSWIVATLVGILTVVAGGAAVYFFIKAAAFPIS